MLGDLGTHPLYIARTILPHLQIKRLMCARQSFVMSRAPLEDNAVTLMEYYNGAIATVWCSAVNAGATSPTACLERVQGRGAAYSRVAIDGRWLDLGLVRDAIDSLAGRGAIVRAWGRRPGLWTGVRLSPAPVAS